MVAGHTVTDSGEEASDLRTLGVERAVDDVLAGFEESTPEEIMALADAGLEADPSSARDDELAVDDDYFDGFVTEDVRPVSSADEAGDDWESGLELDAHFAGR